MATQPLEHAPASPLLAERLLTRASFGPTAAEAARDGGEDPHAWLEAQLTPGAIDETALLARLDQHAGLSVPTNMAGMIPRRGEDADVEEKKAFKREMRQLALSLAGQRVVRAVHAERQLEEVMVDFWINHFNVFARKSAVPMVLPQYEAGIRERAFGQFEDLLLFTAQSPAMLIYLDNFKSSREFPEHRLRRAERRGRTPRVKGLNENYARELLELHTLGVDGGYTQADVVEVARVLTGWSVERPERTPGGQRGEFVFRDRMHDPDDKRVLGQKVPGNGIDEGTWLLRMLARHPSTARHLSTKLCRRFVSDDPPAALVGRVARMFQETEGNTREVLRAIFLSPEFADPENRKLKTPVEFVASSVRQAGGETDGGKPVLFVLQQLGEPSLHCAAPTGFPDTLEAWLDPGAMLERISFGYALAANRIEGTHVSASSGEALKLGHVLASPEFQWQ
jgi:uncharacterized protein (DUF1800 family)